MKTTSIILICYALINYSAAHAMELVPLKSQQKKKNFQINCIQDIPQLSLKNIRPCFEILPEKERNQLLIHLADSLTFNIALLEEQKVRLHILTFVLGHDEIATQLFYKTPLLYAQTRYHSAKKMLQRTSLVKQPVAFLFRLPMDEQKKIIGIITPTFVSQLIDSTAIMIDENTATTIQSYNKEIQENFFVNENIRTITNNMIRSFESYSGPFAFTFVGAICGGLIIAWPGLFPKIFLQHCFNANLTINNSTSECIDHSMSIISLIIIPSCIILSNIWGYIHIIQDIKKEARLINI